VGCGKGFVGLAQNGNRCRAVVCAVMNLRFPQNKGNSLPDEELVVFQDGLCCIKLVFNLRCSYIMVTNT
jgi:hypothetical protein